MCNTISFYSYTKGSGKTTVIFNIASVLAHKKFKVAVVELQYGSQYNKYLNLKTNDFKTQNIMKHYSFHNLNDNLTIFFLNETLNDNNDWLSKQIDVWKGNYDYLLLEIPWLKNSLCDIALEKTDKFINVFDTQNFTSEILVKTLTSLTRFKQINKNLKYDFFILNKYIDQDSNSLTTLAQINKAFLKSIFVKILSFDNNLLVNKHNQWNYAIKEFWSKYAIELNEIVKLL